MLRRHKFQSCSWEFLQDLNFFPTNGFFYRIQQFFGYNKLAIISQDLDVSKVWVCSNPHIGWQGPWRRSPDDERSIGIQQFFAINHWKCDIDGGGFYILVLDFRFG